MPAAETGRWFVLHDLLAYEQHPDMICNRLRQDDSSRSKRTTSVLFRRIRRGDKVVYYATGVSLVVGIFQVVSDRFMIEGDPYWGSDVTAFRIEPWRLPPNGCFLDFKALVTSGAAHFDMIPKREIWHSFMRGHTTKILTVHDFRLIEKNLGNAGFLVQSGRFKATKTNWHRKMSSLLSPGYNAA